MPAPTEIVAGLPPLPGVYRMLGENGEVLYVGKAANLRKRVASYFQKRGGLAPRTEVMVSRVADIEVTVTRSEGEALLLESNLIKTLSPRYNVLFRDDKSYPYLVFTAHDFPRLGFHRGSLDRHNRYFGPFPNAGAVRESIQLLQKVFRLRTCEDTVYANRSRPCLLHQIRRCTAPCVDLVTREDYGEDVRSAELFLKGRDDEVVERLIARMNAAAEALRYEEAALYRDQIAALRKVREKQFVSGESGGDADIIACGRTAGVTCVNLVMVRGGRHLGDKNFYPSNAEGSSDEEVIEAFLAQHYSHQALPSQVVVGGAIDASAFEAILSEQAGRKVQITPQPVGMRRAWLEMAIKNAQLGAAQTLGLQATQQTRLSALQQTLGMPETSHRIECFDISHTMGEATVAACVVYDHGGMQTGEYRRYNIEDVAPGDDYEAMRQTLTRRYRRVVAGEGKMPDLVLIDGGKGQLAVARQVCAELGLNDVMLVAVAKGEERKPGREQLLVAGRDEPLVLGRDNPALHLVQQIRDEAHRFAIEGHRARRGKARTRSPLEEIAGVGSKRRQRLLTRFGGLKGLMAASVDDMAQVEGIGRSLAEKIHRELH
ncbi:MAG: excinuclease ABC subunit UvrC [Betaproteobacteria bacterium]